MGSVGYRVWDPIKGKVFNVGVSHIDESVHPRWWRKENDGEELVNDIDEINFPDLDVDVVEGEREGGQECDQPMPILVEDSSDEEGGEAAIDGDNDDWEPGDDAQCSRWKGDTSMVQCLRELKKKMSQGTATRRGRVCHRYDTSRCI